MKIETEEYTLPEFWACPIINGDYSGCDDSDVIAIDNWLERHQGWHCSDVSEESWFAYRNDANDIGSTVATFTFYREVKEA